MMLSPPIVEATRPFAEEIGPRESLVRYGYAILRGVLDPADVLAMRSHMLHIAHRHGWLAAGSGPDAAMAGPIAMDEPAIAATDAYFELQRSPLFHRLGNSPALVAVAREVLGGEVLPLPSKIGRWVFPNPEFGPTPPHQDYYYVRGSCDTLTTWVPLGDCLAGGGRLVVLAGSHRLGPLEPLSAPQGGFWVETADLGLEWHGGDFKAGDALLFHAFTVHAGEENETNRLRVSCDFRFQPVADHVAPGMLRVHRDIAQWEKIYAGWPDDEPTYYWRNLPTTEGLATETVQDLQARARSMLFDLSR